MKQTAPKEPQNKSISSLIQVIKHCHLLPTRQYHTPPKVIEWLVTKVIFTLGWVLVEFDHKFGSGSCIVYLGSDHLSDERSYWFICAILFLDVLSYHRIL